MGALAVLEGLSGSTNAASRAPRCVVLRAATYSASLRPDITDSVLAAAAREQCVELAAGHYELRSVTVKRGIVDIRGAGAANTTIHAAVSESSKVNADGALLDVIATTMRLSGLTINGASLTSNSGAEPHAADRPRSIIRWLGVQPAKTANITGVAFERCPQVCMFAAELHDSLVISQSAFGLLPVTRADRQSYEVVVRNDAAALGRSDRAYVFISGNEFINADSGSCAPRPSAGGIFLYAARGAAPMNPTIENNAFDCLGGSDPHSPVGAVELYAHVDNARIVSNRFTRSRYVAIKIAASSHIAITGNRIADSDTSAAVPAIGITGCIRGPAYCTSAPSDWRIDSNIVVGFGSRSSAFRVLGGYRMARSASLDAVLEDCGKGRTANAQLVCVDSAGKIAEPYYVHGVRVRWNRIERVEGSSGSFAAIELDNLALPVVTGNHTQGPWHAIFKARADSARRP